MRLVAICAVVCLLVAPVASAQSIGSVRSWVEPEELTIQPFVFVDGRPERNLQSFDVHVEGTIECIIGAGQPFDVMVERNGTRRLEGTSGGETIVYFAMDVDNFTVQWQPVSGTMTQYRAEAIVTVNIQSDGAPPQDLQAVLDWAGAVAEPAGTTRCNPQGYGWSIEASPVTVLIPGTGSGDPTDPGTGSNGASNGTPLPLWLGIAALGLAFARRRSQQ